MGAIHTVTLGNHILTGRQYWFNAFICNKFLLPASLETSHVRSCAALIFTIKRRVVPHVPKYYLGGISFASSSSNASCITHPLHRLSSPDGHCAKAAQLHVGKEGKTVLSLVEECHLPSIAVFPCRLCFPEKQLKEVHTSL